MIGGVIGYSTRAPNCDSIHEFWEKLCNKTDLVEKTRRYPLGYHGLPNRAGHLKNIDEFDSMFF